MTRRHARRDRARNCARDLTNAFTRDPFIAVAFDLDRDLEPALIRALSPAWLSMFTK
jgi:hypothetical protein